MSVGELLTSAEAAQATGYTPAAVRAAKGRGHLVSDLPGDSLYCLAELRRWRANHKARAHLGAPPDRSKFVAAQAGHDAGLLPLSAIAPHTGWSLTKIRKLVRLLPLPADGLTLDVQGKPVNGYHLSRALAALGVRPAQRPAQPRPTPRATRLLDAPPSRTPVVGPPGRCRWCGGSVLDMQVEPNVWERACLLCGRAAAALRAVG